MTFSFIAISRAYGFRLTLCLYWRIFCGHGPAELMALTWGSKSQTEKTPGKRIHWKTKILEYFLGKVKNNLWYLLKPVIIKNRTRVDFYTNVVATTPEDSSLRRRIWRYGKRSFPSMRTASFQGLLPAAVVEVAVAIYLNSLMTFRLQWEGLHKNMDLFLQYGLVRTFFFSV